MGCSWPTSPDPTSAPPTPARGNRHGFDFTLELGQGKRNVCIYAINIDAGDDNTSLGCRSVTAGMPAIGDINSATVAAGAARLQGWAIDPDTADPITVHAYVNNAYTGQAVANVSRADIGRAYPAAGSLHGFDLVVPLAAGKNTVCIYAIDSVPGSAQSLARMPCANLLVDPMGDLNTVVGNASSIDVAGWALDPDTADPISVHVYVDGRWGGALTADGLRDDVARSLSRKRQPARILRVVPGSTGGPSGLRLRDQSGARVGEHGARLPERGRGRPSGR